MKRCSRCWGKLVKMDGTDMDACSKCGLMDDPRVLNRNESQLLTIIICVLLISFFGVCGLQKVESMHLQSIADIMHEESERFQMVDRNSTDIENLKNQVNQLITKIDDGSYDRENEIRGIGW